MQRFEEQESPPVLRRAVGENVVEIHCSRALMDRYARRLQPWSILINFAVQFAVMRTMLRDAPLWAYVPMLSMWLFAFATHRFDLGRRLPGAKARAALRERQATRNWLRLDPDQLLQLAGEKTVWSVAWSDVTRIEPRPGWNPAVVLHLTDGKRRVVYSSAFTETPEELVQEFEQFRARYSA